MLVLKYTDKKDLVIIFELKRFFYPPKRDHPLGDPLGVPFEYLLVLYSENSLLLRKKVLSPGGGPLKVPQGVPFESLSVLYLPLENFF